MSRHIAIIQGHPDAQQIHFGHALANAYTEGAESAGHEVKCITVATLDFPLLRSREDWENGEPPEIIKQCQETIAWADHLLIFYPLWMGTMPALLKGFLEQVLRPGFAMGKTNSKKLWEKKMKGKSTRVVVTMGMPAFFYRWFFFAHSLKSLQRNILSFCGFGPIKNTLIGMVEDSRNHDKWLKKMRELGQMGN